MDLLQSLLYTTIRSGTPLLLVALGEVVAEKAGMLNLGQEGMMLMGAVCGFIAATSLGNPWLGLLVATLAGMLMALMFGVLTIQLQANQVASGLALSIFGAGLSAFMGNDYVGRSLDGMAAIHLPYLSDLPVIGHVLFGHDPVVYLSLVMFAGLWWFFSSSRLALMLRAVGENPAAAHATGLAVNRIRYASVVFGGAMAGLAGGYLSVVYTPLWSEGMTAGKGWIALALVVFASWRIGRIMLGAYLFGFAIVVNLALQGASFAISPNLLAMLPYGLTIVALVWLSRQQKSGNLHAPKALGSVFRATD